MILENIERYGSRMHMAIMAVLKDQFQIDIDQNEAREISDSLALSDILRLDDALSNNDLETAGDILGVDRLKEYSLPGRASIRSAASSRPERNRTSNKTATGAQSSTWDSNQGDQSSNSGSYTSQGTKPTAGGNTQATGQGGASQTDDDEAEIADKEKELADLKKKAGIK